MRKEWERRDCQRRGSDGVPLAEKKGSRPKKTWLYGVLGEMTEKNIPENLCEDREK